MRSKVLFILVIFLFYVPIVSSFEVGNMLMLFIPAVLIVLSILVFVFIIVIDKIKERKGEEFDVDKLGLDVEETKVEKIGPKKEKQPAKEQPKVNYDENIDELLNKIDSLDLDEALKKVSNLVRQFFSSYLNLEYEFTYDELKEELKKKNLGVSVISDAISTIKYGDKVYSKKDVVDLLNEFRGIVQYLEVIPKEKISKKDVEKDISMIRGLLKEGRRDLKRDIKKARSIYLDIGSFYNGLPVEEKQRIFHPIIDYYNQIVSKTATNKF